MGGINRWNRNLVKPYKLTVGLFNINFILHEIINHYGVNQIQRSINETIDFCPGQKFAFDFVKLIDDKVGAKGRLLLIIHKMDMFE